MKLKTLTEGISDVVYHGTTLRIASKIVTENRFKLRPLFVSSREAMVTNSDKLFYMSTARSPRSGYIGGALGYGDPPRNGYVVMVLDGRKLAHRYSGKAMSYFDNITRNHDPEFKDEMEDRVLSNQQEITNATSYIKEMHVGINRRPTTTGARDWLLSLYRTGIPVYLHFDSDAVKRLSKTTQKPTDIIFDKNTIGKAGEYKFDSVATQRSIDRHRGRPSTDEPYMWTTMVDAPTSVLDKLPDDWVEQLVDIVRFADDEDYLHRVHISNLVYDMKLRPSRYAKIFDFMRKKRMKNAEEFVEWVVNKWEPAIVNWTPSE